MDRLKRQMQFLMEIDKLKKIVRHTRLLDDSRYENDAEHGWHLAMMALILSEHANESVNVLKVVKMVLIHDIVEIDAGDTMVYDTAGREAVVAKEAAAAKRLFGMLPDDQRDELVALFEEFEAKETVEAKFARALDRLEPCIQNCFTNGHSWQKYGIPRDRVEAANAHIGDGSERLWQYIQGLFDECDKKGYFPNRTTEETD